jgi:hypothetical protein
MLNHNPESFSQNFSETLKESSQVVENLLEKLGDEAYELEIIIQNIDSSAEFPSLDVQAQIDQAIACFGEMENLARAYTANVQDYENLVGDIKNLDSDPPVLSDRVKEEIDFLESVGLSFDPKSCKRDYQDIAALKRDDLTTNGLETQQELSRLYQVLLEIQNKVTSYVSSLKKVREEEMESAMMYTDNYHLAEIIKKNYAFYLAKLKAMRARKVEGLKTLSTEAGKQSQSPVSDAELNLLGYAMQEEANFDQLEAEIKNMKKEELIELLGPEWFMNDEENGE